jgi:hypothetical protein
MVAFFGGVEMFERGRLAYQFIEDYLNLLFMVRILLIILLLLSWFATSVGILHLAELKDQSSLSISNTAAFVGAGAITLMMWVMLERFRLHGPYFVRAVCGIFYLFLFGWAVSFGYGFWWNIVASTARADEEIVATSDGFATNIAIARNNLAESKKKLEDLMLLAVEMKGLDTSLGKFCGSSRVTPRLIAAREALTRWIQDAYTEAVDQRPDHVGWIATTSKTLIDAEKKDVAFRKRYSGAIPNGAGDSSENFDNIKAVVNQIIALDKTAQGVSNSLSDMAEALKKRRNPDSFFCYDLNLSKQLADVAKHIKEKPAIVILPTWKSVTGDKSTAAAIRILWGTILKPFGQKLTSESMKGEDGIALMAALAVDLGILILTLIRPRVGGQMFITRQSPRTRVLDRLESVLRRHGTAARTLLFDLHFFEGGKQYVVIPGGTDQPGASTLVRDLHTVFAALWPWLDINRAKSPSDRLRSAAERQVQLLSSTIFEALTEGERDDHDRVSSRARAAMVSDLSIYEVHEEDRSLCLRILDDFEMQERRLNRGNKWAS